MNQKGLFDVYSRKLERYKKESEVMRDELEELDAMRHLLLENGQLYGVVLFLLQKFNLLEVHITQSEIDSMRSYLLHTEPDVDESDVPILKVFYTENKSEES